LKGALRAIDAVSRWIENAVFFTESIALLKMSFRFTQGVASQRMRWDEELKMG